MIQYVQSIYFKMNSLRTLRDMAMHGDYMIKLDLRHACLVCPLHPRARPAFWFRAVGDWQFRSVCFGLSGALSCVSVVKNPAQGLMIRGPDTRKLPSGS